MIEIANPACCKQVDMPYWKLLDFSKVSTFLYPILWKGGRYLRALVQLASKGGMCQSIGSWLNSAEHHWTFISAWQAALRRSCLKPNPCEICLRRLPLSILLNFLLPLHWSCPLYRSVLRKRMSPKETEMYRNELKAGQDVKRSRVQDNIYRWW